MVLPAFFLRSQGLRKLYGQLFAPLLSQLGLTQLEMDILLFLANNPGKDTARDIVELRHLAKSHVSAGVESLVERGLLERYYQPGNRKVIHLRLLPAAEEMVEAGREVQRRYAGILFRDFTPEERRQLYALLERIAGNVDAALADPPAQIFVTITSLIGASSSLFSAGPENTGWQAQT